MWGRAVKRALTCLVRGCIGRAVGIACCVPALLSGDGALIWPTPNRAFQEGRSIEAFVQATASGKPESGLFGCVRNGGSRFHEGLDLFPVRRDRRGEALDPVYTVLPGRVVHVSKVAGHSSYGRYVVVQHEGEAPAFHTLYAHLASVASGVRTGVRVDSGHVLGRMGRSAAGYSIPRSRAHLHFEIGFRLTDDFQRWFDAQAFGSKNRHGVWNGMNLVSLDPLAFYRAYRRGSVASLGDYLKRLRPVARIRVHSSTVPDFMQHYPALSTRPLDAGRLVAWDIAFSQYGVPLEWTPRFAAEDIEGRPGDVRVLAYAPRTLATQSCRRVLDLEGTVPLPSRRTRATIEKLFGFFR